MEAEKETPPPTFEMTAKHMGQTPVAPAHGIAAIALDMAMRYHQMNMVSDGVLYQQYKMEGRNLTSLNLEMVFETAMKIELHLLGSSDRIAGIIVDAFAEHTEDDSADEPAETHAPS
jgi:uncharacterized protein